MSRARRSRRPSPGSTSSRAGCGASARGTASRTSARSSRTRSRRPTSWPTPRTPATTPSCSTSSATCCSRSTSSRCCSRSAAPATSRQVAEHCHEKLIRRHPHVFSAEEIEARDCATRDRRRRAAQLGRDQGRRARPRAGIFGEVPENLPGAAARAQGPAPRRVARLRRPRRRAAARGRCSGGVEELEARSARGATARRSSTSVGDVLFAAVNVARKLNVDPELALRAAAERFRAASRRPSALAAARRRALGRPDARRAARLLRPRPPAHRRTP